MDEGESTLVFVLMADHVSMLELYRLGAWVGNFVNYLCIFKGRLLRHRLGKMSVMNGNFFYSFKKIIS